MTLDTKCLICDVRLSRHEGVRHNFKFPVTYEERAEAIIEQLNSDDIAERYEGIINALSQPEAVQAIIKATAESTFEMFVITEVRTTNA